ncbi:MAG: hypothetical protein JNJ46_21805 [Myxococcales bacterium]|nr:hypothetical protein [Myxococcales bacterium]
MRPLKQAVARGDANTAPLIVALHRAYTRALCLDRADLAVLVQAAAKLPSLASDTDLQDLATRRTLQ